MRRLYRVLALCWLPTVEAVAQVHAGGGIDAGYAPSHVWRGMVLGDAPVLMLAPYGSVARGRNALAAGAWTAWALGAVPPGGRSLRQTGSGGLVEADLWAQYTRQGAHSAVSLGLVRYHFPDRDGADHTEAYLRLSSGWRGVPLELSGTVFVELDREEAAYAEAQASWSFSLLPLPMAPLSLVLGTTAGYVLAAPDAAPAGRIAFAGEGLAHVDAALTLVVPAAPFTVHAGVHHQHSQEPAPRVRGNGAPFSRTWGEISLSYAINAPRMP